MPIFVMCASEQVNNFLTNLYKFGFFYLFESLQKESLMGILLWQSEVILASREDQATRHSEQAFVECFHSYRFPLLWQTETFEPIGQIVSQENQMKMNLIGQKTVGRNIAQRKSFFEFSDIQFASGSGLVKMPYPFRTQRKIGNKCMVKVIFEFPECKLIFFFFDFWLGPADYDETVRSFPIPRLIGKLSRLPTTFSEGMVTKILNLFLNRHSHFGYDYVTSPFLVERLDKLVVVESRIGSDTNAVEVFGDLLATSRPKCPSSSCWMGISWTQDATPSIPAVSFEANQGLVTGSSGLFGIVSHPGLFDFPTKHRKNSRIQIENKACARFGKDEHLFAQEVVDTDNAFQFFWGDAFQKFPQGGRLGEIFQTQDTPEAAVVVKNLGIVNPPDSGDHAVNKRQYHFCGLIQAGLPLPRNISLQKAPQIQFSAKSLKKQHTSEVRQPCFPEGKPDISDTFGHLTISSLNGRFLSKRNYRVYHTSSSSKLQTFLCKNLAFLAFFQDKLL